MDRNNNMERPRTPVAMMEYPRGGGGGGGVDTIDKHTTLDSVEMLRQRKRELEEQIHQHTEQLRMPAPNRVWTNPPTATSTNNNSKMLLQHPKVKMIRHLYDNDDDEDDASRGAASSASSTSTTTSWEETHVGHETIGATTINTINTTSIMEQQRSPTTQRSNSYASAQQHQHHDTSMRLKPKLASFLKHAEHRVQISHEVSSVSCSEFGDSYCCEEGNSQHDSISTYQIPRGMVMNYLLQHGNDDDDDDDDEEEGKNEEDWNPNDEHDLQHHQQKQQRRTSLNHNNNNTVADPPKRVIDTSTLGVFVPQQHVSDDDDDCDDAPERPNSVTNTSAITNITEHSSGSTTDEDVEMALTTIKLSQQLYGKPKSNKLSSSIVVSSKNNKDVQHNHKNDPTLESSVMKEETSTGGSKVMAGRIAKPKCMIITAVILLLLVIVIALLALIGVMLHNKLNH